MENKTKKILSYVYLIVSILIILSLLFSTIYFYKNIQELKTRYGNCILDYSDLNKKYKDYTSDNIHVCICPQYCDRWARENNIIIPMCIGQWEIINGRCSWDCQNS